MVKAYSALSPLRSDAYRLLEYAVREIWSVPCPEIARSPRGKPFFPSRPDIFFSISHSGGRVLAAVADVPVGCDVQSTAVQIRQSVVSHVCRPEELEGLDFFDLWTLKECWLKITDLPLDMRGIVFHARSGLIVPPDPAFSARLYPSNGFQTALVARGDLPKEITELDILSLHF